MNRTRCVFSGTLLSMLLFLSADAAGAQDALEGLTMYVMVAGHIIAIGDPDRSATGLWWGLDSVTVIIQ